MRRRRHSDSDEDTFHFKREKIEVDSVESLIYRVGSKDSSNIEKDVADLASLVLLEIPRNGDNLIKVLTKCVKSIPERMVIYATMVGLLNLKNRGFVSQLMEALQRELRDSVKSAAFDDAKFILMFLSASVNCSTVSLNSILGLYENFAEVTLDIGRSSQSRLDWYTYIILCTLPYSSHVLASHDLTALNDILGTIDVYMTKRQKSHVPLLRVWDSDDPIPQEDYLDCLWAQIRTLRSQGWQEKVLWRLYDSFPSLRELGQPHHLHPLTPPDYDPEVAYPMPRVVFRLFDYTDVIEQEDEDETATDAELIKATGKSAKETAVLPGAHTIERFLVDEQLTIVMNNLSFNRMMCSKAMMGLRTRAPVPLNYMVVEAVFAGLFNLPHPPVQHGNLLFYGSLFIQLCSDYKNSIPAITAQAVEMIYERLDVMKPVCIGRLIEWFSYHLSNYQYRWNWRDWSGAITEDPMSPHRRLITETFARLIRFSYYDNVKRLIPKSFYPLLPPQTTIVNKYEMNPNLPSAQAFFQILNAIRSRVIPADVLKMAQKAATLEEFGSLQSDDEGVDPTAGGEADKNGAGMFKSDEEDTEHAAISDPEQQASDEESAKRVKDRPRLVARRRFQKQQTADQRLSRSTSVMSENETMNVDGPVNDLSHGVTNMSIELFFSALFIAGQKTISHTFSSISKYANVIRTIAATVEAQVEALHVLQAVWANHPLRIVIITEHMCRTGLIDPEAIIRWAYSPIMTSLTELPAGYNPTGARPRILDLYVWECLHRTLTRVGQRVARITKRLNASKDPGTDRRRSGSSSPERRRRPNGGEDDDDDDDDDADDTHPKRRRRKGKRGDKRNVIAGCELVSSDDDDGDDEDLLFGVRGPSGSRIARLEEARCEAVRSQCAVITLLLHRHARLTAEVASAIAGDDMDWGGGGRSSVSLLHSSGQRIELSKEVLQHIAFWLKGRLVHVVLEHCDQLMPYLDSLDEFICGAHPEVQDVFQQLRALHA